MIEDLLVEVRGLYQSKKYDEALSLIYTYSKKCDLSVELLVLKGRLIQLSSGEEYALSLVIECFESALKQDKNSLDALIELGWFYMNVLDNADVGLDYFKRAINVCDNYAKEAKLGIAKSKCA